jgi:hypothetical protein
LDNLPANAESVFIGEPISIGYNYSPLRPVVGTPFTPTQTFEKTKGFLKLIVEPNNRAFYKDTPPLDTMKYYNSWATAIAYFEIRMYPDVIVVTPFEASAEDARDMLQEHYNLISKDADFVVFERKNLKNTDYNLL